MKTNLWSFCEWPFYTSFTVFLLSCVCVSLFVYVLLSLPYGVMGWSMIVVVPAYSYLSSFFFFEDKINPGWFYQVLNL